MHTSLVLIFSFPRFFFFFFSHSLGRYAQTIALVIGLSNAPVKGTNNINIPFLKITYGEVIAPYTTSVPVSFSATYYMDDTSFTKGLTTTVCVFAAIAVILSYFSIVSYRQRNLLTVIDFQALMNMTSTLLGLFSSFLFWILVGTSLYLLIFYRVEFFFFV